MYYAEKYVIINLVKNTERKVPELSQNNKSLSELVKKLLDAKSVKYTISSVICFVIDYTILLLLEKLFKGLGFSLAMELAAILSFAVSSQINFHINRLWVFKSNKNILAEMGGYYSLALVSFSVRTFVLMELFVRVMKLPTWIAKPIAEVAIFVFNYFIQKKIIFKKKEKSEMKPTLLILAAGLGSRFGGDKQVSHVGPNGEFLMEYSIHDAIKAGFKKVVFVLKQEMIETVKAEVGEKFKGRVELEYAVQDYSSLPEFYTVPKDRVKPFGTVHAVLCAKDYLTDPFVTVNADDYYGAECFSIMRDYLDKLNNGSEAAMVTYILKNTVSENGSVTRGICSVESGRLTRVDETGGIAPENGRIISANGEVDPDSEVSMNFWGFHPDTLKIMEDYFNDFLKALTPDQIKAECLLPIMVNDMLAANKLTVFASPSHDKWFGMTNRADKEDVEAKLKALHENGAYPDKL